MAIAKLFSRLVFALCLGAISTRAEAHFLWLKSPIVAGQRQAYMLFGENPGDEQYHMPDAIAKAEVWRRTSDDERAKLDMKPLPDGDNRIGLVAPLSLDETCTLEANAVYGNYNGTLLTYWAKHLLAPSVASFNRAASSAEFKLDVIPSIHGDELRMTVFWNDEPLKDATVAVTVGDGESQDLKADQHGRVSLRPEGEGLVSAIVIRRDNEAKGEHDGKPYSGTMDVLTLTFDWKRPQVFARLPEPLASFGAAVADGYLYVYGGHVGESHDHSAANLSQHFRRLRQDGQGTWEDLPMQTPLQGVTLVAHGGKLYRVGGMAARNATAELDEDMYSTDEFAVYDPATLAWKALPPLPSGRSSHDAVVIGDQLYVVGGWKLAGTSVEGSWQKDLLAFNLAKKNDEGATWQVLPGLSNSRRAIAAGEWHGKLAVIGGIDEDGAISRQTTFFDPATNEWSDGPQIPEGDLAGFGASAWNLDGRLYVSGLPGTLYRLNDDGTNWEEAGLLDSPRFFHRLTPGSKPGTILAVAGSAMDGHVAEIEVLNVQ